MRHFTHLLLAVSAGLAAIPGMAAAQDAPAAPAPVEAFDCEFDFNAEDATLAALRTQVLGFAGITELCPLLRDAGMGVHLDDFNGAIGEISVIATAVTLYDVATGVEGSQVVLGTFMSDEPGAEVAARLLMRGVNDSLQTMAGDPSRVMNTVAPEVERLRAWAAVPAPEPMPPVVAEICKTTYNANDDVTAFIQKWTDFTLASDALCLRMAEEGAGIFITQSMGYEEEFGTYAWVMVRLYDVHSHLPGAIYATSFSLDPENEEGLSEAATRNSLALAMAELEANPDPYFASLVDEMNSTSERLAPSASAAAQ